MSSSCSQLSANSKQHYCVNEIPIKVVKKKRYPNEKKSYEIDGEKEKEANKHEKVNGMVKWNYLGHRRTVDPNKVKGMAKTDICITHIHIYLG